MRSIIVFLFAFISLCLASYTPPPKCNTLSASDCSCYCYTCKNETSKSCVSPSDECIGDRTANTDLYEECKVWEGFLYLIIALVTFSCLCLVVTHIYGRCCKYRNYQTLY